MLTPKLINEICPLLPPQTFGLVPSTLFEFKLGGTLLTVTDTLAVGEVHPATFCTTLIIYTPGAVAVMFVELVVALVSPALGLDDVQLYVAFGLLVTLKLTKVPKHEGLGLATKFAGAGGEPGSERLTGPL